VRLSSSITSVSWIPSEAITGHVKLPMLLGIGHYDDPPPDRIAGEADLQALRAADRFRFANHLAAWIEVEDGRIVDAGYAGGGLIGSTTANLGVTSLTFPAVAFPDLQREPEIDGASARFVQTAGGRTGAGMPRRVDRPPYVRLQAPTAWTTLSLTLYADGGVGSELAGASSFPRHWLYDADGVLTHKSGAIDFAEWAGEGDRDATPWGDRDAPALVTAVETALERELSLHLMRGGARPRIRTVAVGETFTEQDAPGTELFVLLDGIVAVEVNGTPIAEVGPGAVLGERAVLEGGRRTSTLRALTAAKIAVARSEDVDRDALRRLAEGHRREEQPTAGE
jgi:hypothetical protein